MAPAIVVVVVVTPLMSWAWPSETALVRWTISALNCVPNPSPPAPSSTTSSASACRPANRLALSAV